MKKKKEREERKVSLSLFIVFEKTEKNCENGK